MRGIPWTPTELLWLEELAGNVPPPALPTRYNGLAVSNGYPRRTPEAIESRVRRSQLTTSAIGNWITTGLAAKLLGFSGASNNPINLWVERGYLKARRFGSGFSSPTYIRRCDLRALARERPELFAGIEEPRLIQVLEDEALAAEIAQNHPRRKARPRPVRCVETGKVYPTVRAAARQIYVTPRAITWAIETGNRAAGRHWQEVIQ